MTIHILNQNLPKKKCSSAIISLFRLRRKGKNQTREGEWIKMGQDREKVSVRKFTKSYSLFSILAIMIMLLLLVQLTLITPAHALTRYYNCIARVANKNGTLSIANADACYNLVFKGAADYYGNNSKKQGISHDDPVKSLKNFEDPKVDDHNIFG
jgi:hypothetical protein